MPKKDVVAGAAGAVLAVVSGVVVTLVLSVWAIAALSDKQAARVSRICFIGLQFACLAFRKSKPGCSEVQDKASSVMIDNFAAC